MGLTDIVPVIVFFNQKQREVYEDIVKSVGLSGTKFIDIVNNDLSYDRLMLAKRVGEVVGEQKSVVIGEPHCLMTFCYNDEKTTSVLYDGHNDSYPFKDEGFPYFGNGSFLLERKGPTIIAGTIVFSDIKNIKTYRPRRARYARRIADRLEKMGAKDIFLSFEVDVLHKKVTTAHGWNPGHMSFEDVLDSSIEAIEGRNLRGINIAGYRPSREESPYHTAELLKEYLNKTVPHLIKASERISLKTFI
tara:strand:+ start:8180 stop:8920 length:741 start_codon:yes stop_codon:yes gene_type:complete